MFNKYDLENKEFNFCKFEEINSKFGPYDEKILIDIENWAVECLWQPKLTSDHLIVFMSSGGRKSKGTSFARWSQPQKYSVLNIEDPLYKKYPELTTTWYYGDHDFKLLEKIAEIILTVAKSNNIISKNIIIIGSSAGGYAALILANLILESNAIAMNPQIKLKNWGKVAEKFSKVTSISLETDDYRNDLTKLINKHSKNKLSRYLILANSESPRDWDTQSYLLFKEFFGNSKPVKSGIYVNNDYNIEFAICCGEGICYPHSHYFDKGSIYQAIDYIFNFLDFDQISRIYTKEIERWKNEEKLFFYEFWFDQIKNINLNNIRILNIDRNFLKFRLFSTETSLFKYIRSKSLIEIIPGKEDRTVLVNDRTRRLLIDVKGKKWIKRIHLNDFHNYLEIVNNSIIK